MGERVRRAAPLVLLALAALLPYLNVFQNDWTYYDDYGLVVERSYIRTWSWHNLAVIWTPRGGYAPVRDMAYLVDHTLFGPGIAGFQAMNLLWWVLGVLALYGFVRRQWGSAPVAFLAALLFAAHPIHVEAVAWTMGRKDLMCFAFSVWACTAYWAGMHADRRPGRWYALAAACLLLALGSKLAALGLPVALVALELCDDRPDAAAAKCRVLRWLLFAVLTAAWMVLAVGPLRSRAFAVLGVGPPATVPHLDLAVTAADAQQRAALYWPTLWTMAVVTWKYVWLWLWPFGLSALYFPPLASGWLSPRVLAGCVGIAAVLVAGVLLWRRGHRRVAFWIGWAVAFYLPVSNVMPVAALMNDRYIHIPSAAGSVLLAAGLLAVARARPAYRRPVVAGALGLTFALACGTVARTTVWRSARALWEDAARKYPDSIRLRITLAALPAHEGRPCESVRDLQALADVAPDDYRRLQLLGTAATACGRLGQAIETYGTALRLYPDDPKLLLGLAVAEAQAHRYEDALAHASRILELSPRYAPAHQVIGVVHALAGRPRRAAGAFERAVEADPGDPTRYRDAARSLMEAGAPALALRFARGWYGVAPGPASALAWVRALAASDQPVAPIEQELEVMRKKYPDAKELQSIIASLLAQVRTSAGAGPESDA